MRVFSLASASWQHPIGGAIGQITDHTDEIGV
jgi:hypothetical protein